MNAYQALKAAGQFMEQKGYPDSDPVSMERAEDSETTWYLIYELAEGTLDLEVGWDGDQWHWDVVDFIHHHEKDETLTGSGR